MFWLRITTMLLLFFSFQVFFFIVFTTTKIELIKDMCTKQNKKKK